jgi:membrane protein YdbS with pleckstrin-like domain
MLATMVFALVARFARRPVRLYRILASIALLVSFLNPIMAQSGQFPASGMNLHIFWSMIVMHCVAALIMVSLLTRLSLTSKREH